MRFLYSLTVICMPLFGGPEMAGPRVTGRWLQLPQANSVAVLSVTAPVLQAVLTNEERVGVRVRLDGHVALDGARVALPVRTVDLGAGETKQIAVTLPVGLAELNALRYSGRVLMQFQPSCKGRKGDQDNVVCLSDTHNGIVETFRHYHDIVRLMPLLMLMQSLWFKVIENAGFARFRIDDRRIPG